MTAAIHPTSSLRNWLVLWNPRSGSASSGRELRRRLDGLGSHGFHVVQLEPKSAKETARLAGDALDNTLVIAAGGDGTAHAVAQGVLGRIHTRAVSRRSRPVPRWRSSRWARPTTSRDRWASLSTRLKH